MQEGVIAANDLARYRDDTAQRMEAVVADVLAGPEPSYADMLAHVTAGA